MAKNIRGKLEVICGSMFSGKTEELMFRLRRAEYAKKKVITLKHQIDNRSSFSCIVSHNGGQREAYPLGNEEDSLKTLLNIADESVHILGIDEIQFFPPSIVSVIRTLVKQGKRVIVAGLDLDYRGEPFGIVPHLMALADEVTKLRAICTICGDDANFSQRLINGEPAKHDDPTILVGGKECYEPRCRSCFIFEDSDELAACSHCS